MGHLLTFRGMGRGSGVDINMAFGGDRRELVFSVLALYYQPLAQLLLDSCKFKP